MTLLHLDLDAFGMVCNGLGRDAGERLLVHTAQRLKSVLAREKVMIARFDGDEFGILVENTATTPSITTIVAAINGMLAEPVYIDGHGVAVSASVGAVQVVSCPPDPAELLRAADQALRRAKSKGRGQWELFDLSQDPADRATQTLAVAMPGAWERGEITVRYRPVVRLTDGGVAGVEAVLHWDRPEGPVSHERCVELAEKTGLILPLGEWLLDIAGGQVKWWQRNGFASSLTVALTTHQASDANLVSKVVQILDNTCLQASRLVASMPVDVVRVPEAADNLGELAEMGVKTALDDFGLGPDDLAAVQDHSVHSIRVARRLVDRQTTTKADYIAALIPALRDTGTEIVVDGISTAEQATWWREAAMEYGQSLDVVDTADLENAAELALTAFCWWRTDIPQNVCEAYWRDVHGIMFARPNDQTYLGWIELAVRDESVVGDLLAGAAAELADQVGAVHTYPVREVYTIISAGRPTEAVLNLLFGDAVRGLDQLRRRT